MAEKRAPEPFIFLMDGHLTKTRGGKKGQIRPMARFRFSFQRHGRQPDTSIAAFNLYFLEPRFMENQSPPIASVRM